MNKLSFTIAFRNLVRRPLLSCIKIVGLSVGVTGCVIVFLLAMLELSFDKFHPNGDRIYRVYTSFSGVWEGQNSAVPLALPDALRERANGIEVVSQALTANLDVEVPDGSGNVNKFAQPNLVAFTDHHYFEVFQSYRWIIGTPEALDAPNAVVILASKAKIYFGDIDLSTVVGKRLIYQDSVEVTVAGILADPTENTDFNFTDFISLSTARTGKLKSDYNFADWGSVSSSWQCLIRLSEGTDVGSVNELLTKMAKEADAKNTPDQQRNSFTSYQLQPLGDIHFNTKLGTWDDGRHSTSLSTIQALVAIALLLLIIAVINFVNLETAQALRRAREVGLRKVMGGTRAGLLAHFISESFVVTSIAVLLSVPLSKLTILSFRDFLPAELAVDLTDPNFIMFIAGLITVVPLLSGIYPAMAMSSYQPVEALKMRGMVGQSGSAFMRKVLTVFQFTFSQALIAGALIVGFQIAWMANKDLGFTRDAVLTMDAPWFEKPSKRAALRHELGQLSSIAMINQSSRPPSYVGHSSTTLIFNDGKEDFPNTVQFNNGDTSYVRLFDLKLIAGRNVLPVDSLGEILINETYCDELGVAPIDMVGKDLSSGGGKTYHVVGVLRDFHHASLRESIEPWFFHHEGNANRFSLKLAKGANAQDAMAQIAEAWKKTYPDQEMKLKFLDETLQKFYDQDRRTATLANTATGLAIFISCLGLFGLASFTAIQRTKEIGIRKVLGASVNGIITLLSREFLVLVLVSFVFAVPIAWYVGTQWLSNFAYRMDMSTWIFLLTGVLSVITALLTVGFHAAKAALKNPVDSLRYE